MQLLVIIILGMEMYTILVEFMLTHYKQFTDVIV